MVCASALGQDTAWCEWSGCDRCGSSLVQLWFSMLWPDGIWFSCGSFVCGLGVFGLGVVQLVACVVGGAVWVQFWFSFV